MKQTLSTSAQRWRSGAFWALSLLLVLVFLLGGGSRADIASLMVLRPVSALLLAYGLWGLSRQQIRENRFLFGMASAVVALVALQLVPLPPAIWSLLPGRDLIGNIDRAAGLGAVWRPLSMVPSGTWNALFSLIPPLAALVLAVRLTADERWALLPVILAIGILSGVIALLQQGDMFDGSLYFYDVTSTGSPVGLFANRNHHSVFLGALIPMLAVYASAGVPSSIDYRLRTAVALAAGLFLVALILVIGSRAGLIVLVFAIFSIPFLYRFPAGDRVKRFVTRRSLLAVVVGVIVIGLAVLTAILGRALSMDRLFSQPVTAEVRYNAWGQVVALAWHYFPAGTGFGTFQDVFKVDEPHRLLSIFTFNHAHNDWLELLLTGGLAAYILLGAAVVAVAVRIRGLSRAPHDIDHLMASLGLWVMALFAIASLVDYPLRVPSIACLFSVALIWICSNGGISWRQESV